MPDSTTFLMPVVVMISGRGSHLNALINAIEQDDLPVTIKAVISNNNQAGGLIYAKNAKLNIHCFDKNDFPDHEIFDKSVQACIDTYSPKLIILAGYMRILSDAFVLHYHGRLLNIHPSLLPEYPGLSTHQRAINDRVLEHGASVHFVTEELDGGPVVLQAKLTVNADDTAETLAKRVLAIEHPLYIIAIRWFATGKLLLQDNTIYLEGQPLHAPKQLEHLQNTGYDIQK